MPLYRIQVKKGRVFSDRTWSNEYLVSGPSLEAARNAGLAIQGIERQIHAPVVEYRQVLVSTVVPLDNVYTSIPLNGNGERVVFDAEYLPMFNTFRADIEVAGGGRPSRKYFRGPVLESDQSDGALVPGVVALVDAAVNQMIEDVLVVECQLVDPDAQEWIACHTFAQVQMRQLHRKRKKKTT